MEEYIQNKKIIKIYYDGVKQLREVELYVYYNDGQKKILVYQVSGYSSSNNEVGWKRLVASNIDIIDVTDESFELREFSAIGLGDIVYKIE